MQWIPFAMVRITAIFIAGVFTGIYSPDFPDSSATFTLFLVSGILYIPVRFTFRSYGSLRLISGITGLTSIFFAGSLTVFLRNETCFPDHLLANKEKVQATKVMITGSVEEKEKSWKRAGRIEQILTENGWESSAGRVNLYWPKAEPVRNLDHGDRIIIRGTPQLVNGPLNPHEFDLRQFLSYRNVFHQQYIMPGQWFLMSHSIEKGFLYFAHRARVWSVNALKKYIHEPHEQGIAIALVLGVTDGVDNELQNAYAASGAMHVLAVSGLHISIIYGILVLTLGFLNRVQGGQWLIAAVSLILLWAYAFVTGLSPSVLRAVVMFSFVVVANPFGRRTNIYNTLAASAFCLLLYDPFLIMSVGFQLSYLAVLGIVCLYRPIYNVWTPDSRLVDWAWQITCVSIAAQIATLPLTLFYFHQFPVYALLSNLFVIPGSFVVLVAGLFLLLISPITSIATWVGMVYEWFVRIFNDGLFIVEKFPGSLIQSIYISAYQAFLLAACIVMIMLLLQFKRFRFLILSLLCVILFSALGWYHLWNEVNRSGWTVYAVKGHSALEWKEGSNALFAADSVLLADTEAIRYHIQPARIVNGVSETTAAGDEFSRDVHGLRFYRWKGKTFIWIRSQGYQLPNTVKVDCIVVSNNAVRSVRKLAEHVTFNQVILDGSNSNSYASRLVKEAQSLNLALSFVQRDGAFTLNF